MYYPMKKKTPIKNSKNFLLILLSTIIILGLSSIFINKSGDNKSTPLNFSVGKFVFNTNDKYLYSDSKRSNVSIQVSNIKNYGEYGECGNSVGNIYTFIGSKRASGTSQDQDYAGYIDINSWDRKDINFINNKIKSNFEKFEQGILKLTNKKGSPIQNATDFNLGQFLYCGGIFSIPIRIDKVQDNKFDSIYYAEVIEGNGDYGTPSKKLIVNHKDSILIFTESAGIDLLNYDECHSNKDSLKCVITTWNEKYRNQDDIDTWIKFVIASLEYKD